MSKERLDKIVATQCVVTRKEARKLIFTGAVCVNGLVEKHIDFKAETDSDEITVNGTPVVYKKYVYIIMNIFCYAPIKM